MLKNLIIFAILFILFSTPVSAATIYVSPSGTNNGAGTKASPYSLSKGLEQLSNGDTLILRGGIYQKGRVAIANKNNITIKNEPGEWPIIDGGWSNTNNHPAICTNYPSNLSVSSEFQALLDISRSSNIFVAGVELKNSAGRGILVADSEQVEIANTKVDTTFAHGVTIYEAGTPNQNGVGVLQAPKKIIYRDSELTGAAKQREFLNKTNPCDNSVYRNWPYNIHAVNSDYVLILRNYIHDNYGEGPSAFRSRNVLIDSNIVANNAANLLYVNHSQNTTYSNNIAYQTVDYNPKVPDNNGVNGFPMRDETESDTRPGGNRSKNVTAFNNLFIGTGRTLTLSKGLNIDGFDIHHNTIVNSIGNHVIYQAKDNDTYIRRNSNFHHNLFWGDANTSGVSESGVSWYTNAWSKQPVSALRSNTDVVGGFTLQNPINIQSSKEDINIDNYKVRSGNVSGAGINDIAALKNTVEKAGVKGPNWDGSDTNNPTPTPTIDNPTPTPTVDGPTPTPTPDMTLEYDLNGDERVDILDIITLIRYVFGG